MVLLDLQKAFDTVNHYFLLMKLTAMGSNNTLLSSFRSYLPGRTQCVSVNSLLSTHTEIVCGVPQGSILGSLLFLVYVNDMERAVSYKPLLCANDSALLVSGRLVGGDRIKPVSRAREYQSLAYRQQIVTSFREDQLNLV